MKEGYGAEDAQKWVNTLKSKGPFYLSSYIYNLIWSQIQKGFKNGVD